MRVTLLLLVGVARGHRDRRRRHRVDRDGVPLSRPRYPGVGAGAAAGLSGLHRRLRLRRHLRCLRAGADHPAEAATGWKPTAASWYPNVRSLPGAIFVFSIVLYPYVFLAARAMFQTQSASLFEVARTLGASPLHAGAPRRPAARAACARGRPRARDDGDAERHRRVGISRRAHADALDLHHMAQPFQPARRRADRLRDAGRSSPC